MKLAKSLSDREQELKAERGAPIDAAEALHHEVQGYIDAHRRTDQKFQFLEVQSLVNVVTITRTSVDPNEHMRVTAFGPDAWTIDGVHLVDIDDVLDAVANFLHGRFALAT